MELAKIRLSDQPFAHIREEYLTAAGHLEIEISRDDYEKLIDPWLIRTLDCVQQSLSDAGITAQQIDKIMLVGGVTRTPAVQGLLMRTLGMEPRHEINPDLVVAMGAAIQGASLAGQPAPAILVDISAHTYSVLAITGGDIYGDRLGCCPVVRRGTPLPVTKADLFTTSVDSQEQVRVAVFQGESEDPYENLNIGEFIVNGLSAAPAGNPIIVQFRIDLNGLLTATATEKVTGLAKSVTIDTAGQHRINLDAARTNLAALFEEQDAAFREADDAIEDYEEDDDEDDVETAAASAAPAELLASAKSLRNRAGKLLEQSVAEADAFAIQTSLAAIPLAIDARDWATLRATLDTLSDLLFYLED
jgi:molecular chaperone DnaK